MPLMVKSDARNFETIPSSVFYQEPDRNGFLTASILFAEQTDDGLLEYALELQDFIREEFSSTGIQLVNSPEDSKGLYFYPRDSLHSSLVDFPYPSRPTFQEVNAQEFSDHEWTQSDKLDLNSFQVTPRWFYTGPNGGPAETSSFSLQIFFESKVRSLLLNSFDGNAKIYCSKNKHYVRSVTNLARFVALTKEDLDETLSEKTNSVFNSLHNRFESQPETFEIDTVSLVKSNSWLSNKNPILKNFSLA